MTPQEIERARSEISDLVHRYAYFIRIGRPDDVAKLFTETGRMELRSMNPLDPETVQTGRTLQGVKAIEAYVTAAAQSGIKVCPMIHNLIIEIDGEMARSNCIMTSRTWPGASELIGEYQDTFRCASGWRFESRQFTMFTDAVSAELARLGQSRTD